MSTASAVVAWPRSGPQDLPVIMGTVLIGAVVVVIMNLIVDIAYSFIDPRVRLS